MASLAFLVVVAGIAITFEPPVRIRLDHNDENDIQVSFWESNFDLSNETLALLGSHDVRLYGWFNQHDVVGARQYADAGVTVVKVIGMPENKDDLESTIQFVNATMDFWDANNLTGHPWLGFAFDKEEMDGISRYNSTKYSEAQDAVRSLADFISARGYGLYQTEYMLTINDLLDGDAEVAINNFDPIDFSWNLTHFDWMIYRAEIAIEYNEPSPIFTYEWARWIRYYSMTMGGPELFSKTSMSIGVTSDELPLYKGYQGLAEIIIDAQICQSVGIPEIIIFILGRFLDEYGNGGLKEFMTALNGYDHVDIPFNRRATFFGNLKGNENPTGSVFGFFFQDKWLDEWVGAIPVTWLLSLCITPLIISFIPLKYRKGEGNGMDPQPTKPRSPVDMFLIITRSALVVLTMVMAIYAVVSWINLTIIDMDFIGMYL